ncbi:response regulator transcription factor [Sedimenticola selenatireducens]|uniref:Response regulator transcription factor n=1 Tax=Sedimenticola selenatireducens TaxID=191960 RepID=A0A558DRX4_9GAMM|nr:response regulator transcription factor [Sedimenticola selenatireducens]TVO75943.1 response regulator transcription factor [Sedimenticola selenatireducens]TVT63802.1 MAG: response regulator transcription factor [Sedimenticola selenatireducens]
MRVLVVEDEASLRSQLQKRLVDEGYSVDVAADGEEGLYFGQEYPFDLAIIDLGLPKLSGIELIRRLRQQQISFPILILTARDNWQDKVEGLEVGGDDYLVKPFNMEELRARLNALLRRSAGYASPQITWGPITLNTARQQASLDNKEVVLTAYEYKVLEYLMLHAGKVISKTELTEHIYDQDFDRDSNVLEVFIRRLRRKFDPEGELKPIETLRGRGYRFSLQQPPA